MSGGLVLLASIALIALSAFFVVIEFALLGARRHRLESLAPDSASARAALRGMNELTIMLAGAQLGITVCTFALGAITKPFVDGWLSPVFSAWGAPEWLAGGAAFALSLLVVTFLHLVIGEMAPKSWAIAHPERSVILIGIPARAYIWVFRPFLLWINRIANSLVRRSGVEPVDKAAVGGRDADTIRHLVEYSAQVGVLEPELRTQITGVIALQNLTAEGITAGSSAPTAVSVDASVAEVRAAAQRSGHLRILLFDAAGDAQTVVHVRDTLLAEDDERAARFARPILTLDAATPVYEVLRRMRASRVQIAVVHRDRSHGAGKMAGVLTLTDVVKRVLPEPG